MQRILKKLVKGRRACDPPFMRSTRATLRAKPVSWIKKFQVEGGLIKIFMLFQEIMHLEYAVIEMPSVGI